MAINFPDTKNPNDTFSVGDKTWIWDGTTWKIYSSTTSGISLSDLSVTTASAGTSSLSYNNSTGVFTYTPPDLSGYITQQYTLPTASTTVLGGVKVDGSSINIDANGVISGASTYSLPTATTTVLGGVKIDGSTITINNGVITASSSSTTTNLNLTDESGDTECFPVFCGAPTNNQTPHTNASLKFNATSGQLTASSFKKIGGTSSEFLKADGSIDSSTYLSADPLVPPVVIGGDTPATAGQTQLTLRSNSQVGLSLLCGAIQNSTITFGGVADGYSSGASGYDDGKIMYDNSNNHMQFNTAGGERLRIGDSGQIGLSGANYGTSGQFLKSTGNSSAAVWDDVFSGSYTDLTNKPTIPTATSQLTNDSGFITSGGGGGRVWILDDESISSWGSSKLVTGIPTGGAGGTTPYKRITILFAGVAISNPGSGQIRIRLGTSTNGIDTQYYKSASTDGQGNTYTASNGFIIGKTVSRGAGPLLSGSIVLDRNGGGSGGGSFGDIVQTHTILEHGSGTDHVYSGGGIKEVFQADDFDRIQFTIDNSQTGGNNVNLTGSFSFGSVSIYVEF